MISFDDATALRPAADDGFVWDVPDGWQQGRGAWGGLVVGALLRAVAQVEPDPVRSISVQMMAPALAAEHRVSVDVVRRGRAMTTWSARATSADGESVAALVAVTGTARSTDLGVDPAALGSVTAPSLPPAEEVPVVPVEPPLGPVFGRHVEFRPHLGLPLAGHGPHVRGWVRLHRPPVASAAWLLGLVDSYWPASLAALDRMPRMATVMFTANLLVDPSTVDPVRPLAFESAVTAAYDGYTSEYRRLWTPDGRLAVDNLQTIVVG